MNIVIHKHGNSYITLKMCPECSSFHLEYIGPRSVMEIVGKGLWSRLCPMSYQDYKCNLCGCEFSIKEEKE